MKKKNEVSTVLSSLQKVCDSSLKELKTNIAECRSHAVKELDRASDLIDEKKLQRENSIKEIQEELKDNIERQLTVSGEYKNSLLLDDKEAIEKCELKLKELKLEEAKLEQRIKVLEDAVSESDNELEDAVASAIVEYNKSVTMLGQYNAAIEEAKGIVAQCEKTLTEVINKYSSLATAVSFIADIDAKAFHLYEKMYGIIDVKGHQAGSDSEAKKRFIRGVTVGIENTVAGKALIMVKNGGDLGD